MPRSVLKSQAITELPPSKGPYRRPDLRKVDRLILLFSDLDERWMETETLGGSARHSKKTCFSLRMSSLLRRYNEDDVL